jgi:hypothetical protein
VAPKWGSLCVSHSEAVLWDGGLGGAIVEVRDSDNTGEAAPINSFSERARTPRAKRKGALGSLSALWHEFHVLYMRMRASARPRTSLNAAA